MLPISILTCCVRSKADLATRATLIKGLLYERAGKLLFSPGTNQEPQIKSGANTFTTSRAPKPNLGTKSCYEHCDLVWSGHFWVMNTD